MSKFTDLMIDLETLGNTPQTPILSIGACFFNAQEPNPLNKDKIGPTFELILQLDEQIARGRKPDGSTVQWWMSQSDEARAAIVDKDKVAKPAEEVLNLFARWITENNKDVYVWGNGSTFDISILEDAFRDYGIKTPWGYNKVMDLRTYRRFVAKGEKVKKLGVAHRALDDAISQARFVMENFR